MFRNNRKPYLINTYVREENISNFFFFDGRANIIYSLALASQLTPVKSTTRFNLIFFFINVVLAAVRAKSFRKPILLPPSIPSHLFTNLITVVDTESGNAVSLVESGCPLHDLHLFCYLCQHFLNTRQLEYIISQSSQPGAP